ncbi:MAG: alpha,alpha-trehalose-phosphate synthase (UDP-forming) [Nitriliruptorales bacterium]
MSETPPDVLERPLVAIANRLPISRVDGAWKTSAGGLVTALKPIMERVDGAWVGWDGGHEDVPPRAEGLDIDLLPIPLTHAELQGFYYGFSNRTLWPLFHDLLEQPIFDRGWWNAYRQVNERFAERTRDVDFPGRQPPLLWVQDYHLMLLPALLRERGSEGPIAFFLHIPFPPPELFARLPWRRRIIEGLLGADVVGFHTARYRDNFIRSAERLSAVEGVEDGAVLLRDGRRVAAVAHPISVDAGEFARLAQSDEVNTELASLRQQFAGRKVLLGVDRLDYTKGIHERLKAIERLLERRSDLRNRITFVQIAVPSREGVREYRELRRDVEREVGRINGRFTEPGGEVPVYYLHRGVPRHRLVAYYRLADVAVVTPLKDGMNLIAKEFVVCQHAGDGAGALVLSEYTGAALELDGAVQCNPFDVEGLSHRIEMAIELDEEERRKRLARMAGHVRANDVFAWVEDQLGEVARAFQGA